MGEYSKRKRAWCDAWSIPEYRDAALWLWSQKGVGLEAIRWLARREELLAFVEYDESDEFDLAARLEAAGIAPSPLESILECRPATLEALEAWVESVEAVESMSNHAIGEPAYPDRLYDLEDPPAFLFVIGTLGSLSARDDSNALAVVGSREIPAQTAEWVEAIVGGAARRGVAIVSGGALGADAMAHRATLKVGAATVSVMPCGVDAPRPKTNSPMFRQIIRDGGALVSEYPPGTGVRSFHYPRRNRLIAALGDATLVLRAGADSGTMLTARAAQAIDRPLGAVPGRPGDRLVAGCHQLMAEDAMPVTCVDDVLEALLDMSASIGADFDDEPVSDDEEVSMAGTTAPSWPNSLSERAESLLEDVVEAIDEETYNGSMDDLARASGVAAGEIQSAVLEWELAGLVSRSSGGGGLTLRLPNREE